ncbi:hypothetical protein FH972_021621 [Carpinus fangiana]|uniref:Peptidase A1 domain-containing protein n=1 Tax=Carpinus fangiana TaxID=176857 RepID=A0A5N6KPW3_9ROSI|nr:hypothetical protein FH972_021621 [Carpinus fangiana]
MRSAVMVMAAAALGGMVEAQGFPAPFQQPPTVHFPIFRRGGIFAGANWTADLPYLLEQVHAAESRFNLTQREVRGNKVVRVPKDGALGGGEASTLMGSIGSKDRWYANLGFGSNHQNVHTDIDLLSSDFVVRSTSSEEGTRFDDFFSSSYGKMHDTPRINFAHCRPRPQSRDTLLASGAIMGLAPSDSLKQMDVPTLLDQLLEKKIIQHKVFSATIISGAEGLLSIGGTAAEQFAKIESNIDIFLGKEQENARPANLGADKVEDDRQDQIDAVNGASEELLGANKGEAGPVTDAPAPAEKPSEEQPGVLKKLKRGLEDMVSNVLVKRARTQHHADNGQSFLPSWRDDWKWSPVEGAEGWWQTLMRGVWVDGTKVLKNQPCVLDINAPFILAPPLAVKQFYSAISGTYRLAPPYQNFFAFPCNNPPTLHVEFGGWRFPIMRGMKTYDSSNGPNGKFSLGKVSYDSGYCVGAVVETKMGVGDQAPVKRHGRGKISDNLRAINAMEAGMLAGNGMRDVWVLGEPAFRGLGITFDVSLLLLLKNDKHETNHQQYETKETPSIPFSLPRSPDSHLSSPRCCVRPAPPRTPTYTRRLREFPAMSVVGIDLGSQNTVIAVARNRGVDVITNEVSNRATPSLVGFGSKSRYLGEAAKTQEISNLKNTVSALARLAGRALDDPDTAVEQEYITAPLVDINGQVGAEVTYLGKKEKFTGTQLVAMFLSKIKATASAELKLPVSDVVVSVPAWFSDAQRRSLIDAADIAGLKMLRLMNDTTATALGWGITKLDLPSAEEKPKRVCFVDIGASNYTCSIVEFKKGELAVKSTVSDRHFGGRNFDKALVEHFQKEFKEKYKIDINENLKARTRVLAACEKLKKVLSANASAPLSIESLMNDIDVTGFLKREELEKLVEPLLARASAPLEQALAEAKLTPADIDSVELVGGCTRVPALKTAIAKFFGDKPLSFTLNQDEAIARGCAFSCAILSPVFRVRDFTVHDIVPYPIEFTWEKSADIPDEDTSLTVFNRGGVMPSTKILTFYRKQPFDLEAKYAKPDTLPGKINPWIGRFSVKGVKADDKGDFMICKLKARLNLHGILNVESGYFVEDQEIEEPIPEADGDKKDADVKTNGDEKPKTRKVKKQVRKGELPIASGTASLDEASRGAAGERESAMYMEDKLVADTEEKKNELESFIYELRGKIDDQYSEFADEEEKSKLKSQLETSEDWLYDEGDDATKAVYVAKIDEIRFVAGPIIQRYNDKVEEERQAVQRAEEEARAKKIAALDEQRKAMEEAEAKQKAAEEKPDAEMTDAPVQPESVADPE